MIRLSKLQLSRAGNDLLSDVSLQIVGDDKVALIGPNGAGKSSFFQLLLGDLTPTQGEFNIPKAWQVVHVAQETPARSCSALDHVLDGLVHWRALQAEITKAEVAQDNTRLVVLHGQMDDMQGYQVQHQAETILMGLGFSEAAMNRSVSSFSGGWRMRLNLAQALIQPSELLLLDEPTNHLDLETVHWLEQWLRDYSGTLLIISHDRDFLDAVVQRVLSFEGGALHDYRGNYTQYEQQRAARMAQQHSAYVAQEQRRQGLEQFVARFRAQATKAKQAQSRLKALERMTLTAPARLDSPFHFEFAANTKVSQPLIVLNDAELGYAEASVLQGLNVSLYPGARIGLLGKNGAGKTTLIRHLAGELALTSGRSVRGAHYYPGYFAQHQIDTLDAQATPLLHLQRLSPETRTQTLRDFLGGFGFVGDKVNQVMETCSGGEKARLSLALIAWQKPNLLLLDEPTNHLDLQVRAALVEALQSFAGAVIVVSHDRFLLEATVDEFWWIDQGQLQPWPGGVDDYLQHLLSPTKSPAKAKVAMATVTPHDKKQKAALRAELAPLKRAEEKALRAVESAQQLHAQLQAKLAESDLYHVCSAHDIAELVQQEAAAQKQLADHEQVWMEAAQAVEEQRVSQDQR